MKRLIISTLLVIPLLYSCSPFKSTPPAYPTYPSTGEYQIGLASWYGDKEHGRKTANGETFNRYAKTAAHRTLPMGTMVRVKNLENGRDTIVRINDRGPFISGRIIDLSYAAARDIDMLDKGTARVKVEVISLPSDTKRAFLPRFTVQIGSFKDKWNALVLKKDLNRRQSEDARVERFINNGDMYFRVRVGHYRKKKDAERVAGRLKKLGYRSRVIQE